MDRTARFTLAIANQNDRGGQYYKVTPINQIVNSTNIFIFCMVNRCSTCAQRHPRKLTERPHYAARECASCKIRHSAKDVSDSLPSNEFHREY